MLERFLRLIAGLSEDEHRRRRAVLQAIRDDMDERDPVERGDYEPFRSDSTRGGGGGFDQRSRRWLWRIDGETA